MAIENITRFIQYRDTKANIEALSGSLEEAALSFSTDTGQLGIYTNGTWIWFSQTGTNYGEAVQIPTYPAIYDNGLFIATGTHITFDQNINVSTSGSYVSIFAPITTYFRVGQPSPLLSITGTFWQVPDLVFASGSLAVSIDGLLKIPGMDYQEQLWVSGTYQYLSIPATGTVHLVMYGVPCAPQIQSTTGTAGGLYQIVDSNDVLLLDSNSIQILDSNG